MGPQQAHGRAVVRAPHGHRRAHAPEYHRFMKAKEGTLFRTKEHSTHVEYQTLIKDIVLESDYLGDS